MAIKLVYCLTRKSGMSRDAFQRYWLETHAPLVKSHAAALNMRRYVQSHAFDVAGMGAVGGARGSPEGYDGVMEGWWDSEADLAAALTSPEGRAAGLELLEDERNFIDFARSPIFMTRENEIF